MSHIRAQVVRLQLRLEDKSEIDAIMSRYPWDTDWSLHIDGIERPAHSCSVRSSNSLQYRATLGGPYVFAHIITASQRFI